MSEGIFIKHVKGHAILKDVRCPICKKTAESIIEKESPKPADMVREFVECMFEHRFNIESFRVTDAVFWIMGRYNYAISGASVRNVFQLLCEPVPEKSGRKKGAFRVKPEAVQMKTG